MRTGPNRGLSDGQEKVRPEEKVKGEGACAGEKLVGRAVDTVVRSPFIDQQAASPAVVGRRRRRPAAAASAARQRRRRVVVRRPSRPAAPRMRHRKPRQRRTAAALRGERQQSRTVRQVAASIGQLYVRVRS